MTSCPLFQRPEDLKVFLSFFTPTDLLLIQVSSICPLKFQQDIANRKIRAVQIELDDLFHVRIPLPDEI
jgi:hypothetical protein